MVYTEDMARYPRLVVPGLPHHVTQRGNRGQMVFRTVFDLQKYCSMADHYLTQTGVDVLAFCLMPNHVHFILVPHEADSLARAIHRMHTAYALYSNQAWQNTGHLWQGRFYSCALDAMHLYNAVRYVELNPVRAGIVRRAATYRWSSARAHLLGKETPIALGSDDILSGCVGDWSDYLREDIYDDFSMLREKTKTGRPCCSMATCHRIEETTGRAVFARNLRLSRNFAG